MQEFREFSTPEPFLRNPLKYEFLQICDDCENKQTDGESLVCVAADLKINWRRVLKVLREPNTKVKEDI